MKTLYFVVLHRPEGSKTWTPLEIRYTENPAGNFFASESTAKSWLAVGLKPRHMTSFLHGPKIEVENEFTIGKVVIDVQREDHCRN